MVVPIREGIGLDAQDVTDDTLDREPPTVDVGQDLVDDDPATSFGGQVAHLRVLVSGDHVTSVRFGFGKGDGRGEREPMPGPAR